MQPSQENLVDMVWLSYGRPDPPSCALKSEGRRGDWSSLLQWRALRFPRFVSFLPTLGPTLFPLAEVWVLENKYAGASVNEKLTAIRKELVKNKSPALILSALDEIAWVFNLRGADIKFNPGRKACASPCL